MLVYTINVLLCTISYIYIVTNGRQLPDWEAMTSTWSHWYVDEMAELSLKSQKETVLAL